jgi:hypothetical protein
MTMSNDHALPSTAPDRPGDDWLDAVLRDDAAEHASTHVDDGGFTAKIMAELPPAIESAPAWRKPAVALIWGAAAAGACVALPQVAIDVGREAFSVLATHRVSLPQIGMVLALLGFATWSAAAYALRND